MKIEVNLERKYFISLLIIGLFLIGFVGVYAYNSVPANPAVFGHSVDEMNWSVRVPTNIIAAGFCMNNSGTMDCRTAWPPGGGGSLWSQSGSDINYNIGNVSTTNFMKAAGVCIGSDCRNAWPADGTGGPITTSDCQEVAVNGCDAAVSSLTWSSCPSGKVVTGVKYRYSINGCGGFYISAVQCCALSGGGGGTAPVRATFSANATNGCASGCATITNCTGDWDFCAITQESFKLYDDVTDRKHDIWQCKVYQDSGAWKVYAYYNGGGDTGGYMNCSATCINFL